MPVKVDIPTISLLFRIPGKRVAVHWRNHKISSCRFIVIFGFDNLNRRRIFILRNKFQLKTGCADNIAFNYQHIRQIVQCVHIKLQNRTGSGCIVSGDGDSVVSLNTAVKRRYGSVIKDIAIDCGNKRRMSGYVKSRSAADIKVVDSQIAFKFDSRPVALNINIFPTRKTENAGCSRCVGNCITAIF